MTLEAGLFLDFRQDGGTKLFGIVKGEWIVRQAILLHDPMRAHCALLTPPDPLKCGQYITRLSRGSRAHAAISNVVFAESGGTSPWAIRSRTISRAADWAR